MNEPGRRRATYEDVLAAPAHQVAEVLAGGLHLATAWTDAVSPFRRRTDAPGGTYHDERRVRAEPFDTIEIDLGELWADVEL